MRSKGISFLLVISILLVVCAIAVIAVSLISSQSRFTHHQVSRLQAFYAAQAGVVYTLEMLRSGAWNENSCPQGVPCSLSEPEIPASISQVNIVITPGVGPGGSHKISATANYTFTP